jgi:hypothetical protein
VVTNALSNSVHNLIYYGGFVSIGISIFLVYVAAYMGTKFEEFTSTGEVPPGTEALSDGDVMAAGWVSCRVCRRGGWRCTSNRQRNSRRGDGAAFSTERSHGERRRSKAETTRVVMSSRAAIGAYPNHCQRFCEDT